MKKYRTYETLVFLRHLGEASLWLNIPLTKALIIVFKFCPKSARNEIFADIASCYIRQVSIGMPSHFVLASRLMETVDRDLVNVLDYLRLPHGLSPAESLDYVKLTILDYIYSRFYSMFD